MLKYVLNFRTRGVRFSCVAGLPDQMFTWLVHYFICQWMERKCGGLMMTGDMYSYFSKFSVDQHWNLEHIVLTVAFFVSKRWHIFKRLHIWIEEEWGTRPFIYFCSFCLFIQLHCFLLCEKKVVLLIQKIVLCIADFVLYCIA